MSRRDRSTAVGLRLAVAAARADRASALPRSLHRPGLLVWRHFHIPPLSAEETPCLEHGAAQGSGRRAPSDPRRQRPAPRLRNNGRTSNSHVSGTAPATITVFRGLGAPSAARQMMGPLVGPERAQALLASPWPGHASSRSSLLRTRNRTSESVVHAGTCPSPCYACVCLPPCARGPRVGPSGRFPISPFGLQIMTYGALNFIP